MKINEFDHPEPHTMKWSKVEVNWIEDKIKEEMRKSKNLIEECRNALSLELTTCDVDILLQQVQEARDHCNEWLSQLNKD